jgi:hypothetical protein
MRIGGSRRESHRGRRSERGGSAARAIRLISTVHPAGKLEPESGSAATRREVELPNHACDLDVSARGFADQRSLTRLINRGPMFQPDRLLTKSHPAPVPARRRTRAACRVAGGDITDRRAQAGRHGTFASLAVAVDFRRPRIEDLAPRGGRGGGWRTDRRFSLARADATR